MSIMKSVNPLFSACEYSLVKIRGIPCLFTEMRIDTQELVKIQPHKWYVYELRRSGDAFTAEKGPVFVDFAGMLISMQPIPRDDAKKDWFDLSFNESLAIIGTVPVVKVMQDLPTRFAYNDESLEELRLTGLPENALLSLYGIGIEQVIVLGAFVKMALDKERE